MHAAGEEDFAYMKDMIVRKITSSICNQRWSIEQMSGSENEKWNKWTESWKENLEEFSGGQCQRTPH